MHDGTYTKTPPFFGLSPLVQTTPVWMLVTDLLQFRLCSGTVMDISSGGENKKGE